MALTPCDAGCYSNERPFTEWDSFAMVQTAQRKVDSDKYARIIQAATRIFAEKGFFKATVSDIATAAEVAEGTIYLYFKNKDDVLISIFETSMDMFLREVEEELSSLQDASERLRRFILLHLSLVERHQELAQVLHVELRQSSKFMREYRGGRFRDYLQFVQNLIESGQKQGVFREGLDSRLLRRSIFGALDEAALRWVLSERKPYDLEECGNQLADLFLHGLVKTRS